jgi:hypothetical protein
MLLVQEYRRSELGGKTFLAKSMNETFTTYTGIINVLGLANAGVETLGQTASGECN